MKKNKHYKIRYDNLLEKILNQFIFKLKCLGIKNICEYFKKPKIIKTVKGVNFVNGFIDDFGIYHPIKNEEKIKIPNTKSDEFKMAVWIKENLDGRIDMVPEIETSKGASKVTNVSTPDYIWNNEKWDLKKIFGNSFRTFDNSIKNQKRQANNFIFDISNSSINIYDAIKYINEIYNDPHRYWINKILLIKNGKVIKMFEKK